MQFMHSCREWGTQLEHESLGHCNWSMLRSTARCRSWTGNYEAQGTTCMLIAQIEK